MGRDSEREIERRVYTGRERQRGRQKTDKNMNPDISRLGDT